MTFLFHKKNENIEILQTITQVVNGENSYMYFNLLDSPFPMVVSQLNQKGICLLLQPCHLLWVFSLSLSLSVLIPAGICFVLLHLLIRHDRFPNYRPMYPCRRFLV